MWPPVSQIRNGLAALLYRVLILGPALDCKFACSRTRVHAPPRRKDLINACAKSRAQLGRQARHKLEAKKRLVLQPLSALVGLPLSNSRGCVPCHCPPLSPRITPFGPSPPPHSGGARTLTCGSSQRAACQRYCPRWCRPSCSRACLIGHARRSKSPDLWLSARMPHSEPTSADLRHSDATEGTPQQHPRPTGAVLRSTYAVV